MSYATRPAPPPVDAEADDIAPGVSAHSDSDGAGRWQVRAGDPGQGIALTLMAVWGGALVATSSAVAWVSGAGPADGARSLSTTWWAFAPAFVAAGMAALGGGVQRYPRTLFRLIHHPVHVPAEAGRAERHMLGAIDIPLRLQRALLLGWAACFVGLLALIGFGTSLLLPPA